MGSTEAPAAGASLTGRFAAAIALTIGFYLLAFLIAAGLFAVAILPWVLEGRNNPWVTLTCLVLGVTILVAIFPRRHRFDAPGALGMDPPDEIYANFEADAGVTQAGRGRRVMVVGLPLLQLLTERGLRGVVAHELGHYAGGDTKLGPWIYRTRATIGRTLEHLTELNARKTDRYHSHPALADRLRALEDQPPGDPDTSVPAAELIADPAALEQRVFSLLFGPEAATEFEPVAWKDVPDAVYVNHARHFTAAFPSVLAGITAGGLGEALARRTQSRARSSAPTSTSSQTRRRRSSPCCWTTACSSRSPTAGGRSPPGSRNR